MAGNGAVHINVIEQDLPGLPAGFADLAHAGVGKGLPVGGEVLVARRIPGFLENELVHERVAVETLEGGTEALEIRTCFREGAFNALGDVGEVAGKIGIPTEVAQVAPDERDAVIALRLAPDLLPLAIVVQQQGLLGGIGGDVGLDPVLCPVLAFVPEQPGHLQPDGIRIDGGEGLVALAAHPGKIVRLPALGNHLVEEVDAVDVVGTVYFGLFLHELLLDDREERVHRVQEVRIVFQVESRPVAHPLDLRLRIDPVQLRRHVAGEGRQNGLHVQLPLPGDDLLLEFRLAVQPGHRQRAAPVVDVQHPVPRQVRRAGEIGADFLVGQAQLGPDLIPDGLLAGDGEGQVDALQGHPVDEVFPVVPLPPRHGIAERAVVQEKAVFDAGLDLHRGAHFREPAGHLELVGGEPAHIHMAVILQVVVQAHGHGVRVVAADDDAGALGSEPEDVGGAGLGPGEAEFDPVGGLAEEPVRQIRGGPGVGIVVPGGGNAAGRQEGGRCKRKYQGSHLTK